ncbi:hypothetical protein FOL47_007652 [Perkinsus chesapeaki]|uniref:Exostosin GT47 domain-containing protein n=1 Tax=Perkinsus chesapeaki TaxID=330153 RepID=A0A7J6MVH0_PERCH|nr:hypothetical protein FOL47_007652 [Perkinsus chesapeaki]
MASFLYLTVLFLCGRVGDGGNALCWAGGFTEALCCHPRGAGNPICWDGAFNYNRCCGEEDVYADLELMTDVDENMPNIMTYLSTMDGACLDEEQCRGSDWEALMRTQTLSMTMNVKRMPLDIWTKYLQIQADRAAAITECAAGVAVVELLAISNITDGSEARAVYHRATALGSALEEARDCFWMRRVNHAYFRDYHLFLFDAPANEPDPRCGDNLIYVYSDPYPSSMLYGNPVRCASVGTGFTEVYLHRNLLRSPCRTLDPKKAKWFYVPVYFSCLDLHLADADEVYNELTKLMTYWDEAPQRHLFPFLTEIWKLAGWQQYRSARFVVVEARPVLCDGACHHCPVGKCFLPERDLVLPSATTRVQAERLGVFARISSEREYLVVGHFEHANTTNGEALAQSYRSVNETTRLDLIRNLQGVDPRVSVGGPNLRYGYLYGNSDFCLVPRGRGWWTMRLFEALAYSRCIPVLLSDEIELPFSHWLPWSTIAIRWPMAQADERLYQHLRELDEMSIRRMHDHIDTLACWFDFHSVDWFGCSPYAGLLRPLDSNA